MNLKPILIAAGIGTTLAISGVALASDLKDTTADTAKNHHAMETTKSQAKTLAKDQAESPMPKVGTPGTETGMKKAKSTTDEAEEAEEAESVDGIEESGGAEATNNMTEDATSATDVEAAEATEEATEATEATKKHATNTSKEAIKHKHN